MKTTKNLFFTTALLAITTLFGFDANAQNSTLSVSSTDNNSGNTTKTTNLSVQVGEFYSLNLDTNDAKILLDSEILFANGSQSGPIKMTIFSSRQYEITAKVNSANFNGTEGQTNVTTNNINLNVTQKSGNSEAVPTTRANKSLKHDQAEIIASSTKATKADVFELVYAIPAENTAAFLDQFGKTLTTEITYTLSPK